MKIIKWGRGGERERQRKRDLNLEEASSLQCSKSTSTIPDHGHAITQNLTWGRWVGGGRGDTQGRKRTRHKTHNREAPTFEQTDKNRHTHPHIDNHNNDYTIRALSHSCISAMKFRPVVPGFGRVCFALLNMHR